MKENIKENVKENKKTNTKAQNDLSLLFKYRKFLMGFAALWILMTHEWQIVTNETSFFFVTENFIKRIGFCGVDIFLLLSGMGLYYSLEKNSVSRFYYNRLKRVIFPFIIMASIVSQIDHWTNEFYFNVITGIGFYKTYIYLFLWFVPAVITLYLFTPVFYNFFKKAENKYLFFAGFIELWLLFSLMARNVMREDLYGFTNRIPIFVTGFLIGYLCKEKAIKITHRNWFFILLTFILGMYLAYQSNFKGLGLILPVSNCCIPNYLISISLPLLMAKVLDKLHSIRGLAIIGKGLNKLIGFWGMMSFEFYCVQEWIATKILPDLLKGGDKLLANVKLLIIVSICGLALYLINKAIVWILDLIDRLTSNIGKNKMVDN
jgi:hypothetical protein